MTQPNHPSQGASSPSLPDHSAASPLNSLSTDVVLEHADWLRRLARGLVSDIHDAEDLVQESFGALASVRGPILNLRGYLAQIIRFQNAKRIRSQSRRQDHETMSIDVTSKHQESTDRVAERMDAMRLVLEELGRLPKAQSRAIGLHYVDGLTVAEVAQRLGVGPSTVRSQIARAKATLRARLDRECGGSEAWSLLLTPWCFPGANPATAFSASAFSSSPTASAASAGMATGGLFIMAAKTSLIVLLPLAAVFAWLELRSPAPHAQQIAASVQTPQGPIDNPPTEGASRPVGPIVEPNQPQRVDLGASKGSNTPAEAFPIQGRVVRQSDGTAISGVEVLLRQTTQASTDSYLSVNTDAKGNFLVPRQTWAKGDAEVFVKDGPYHLNGQAATLAFPFEDDIKVPCGPMIQFRYDGEYVDPQLPSRVSIFFPEIANAGTICRSVTRKGSLPWCRLSELPPDGPAEVRVLAEGDFVFAQSKIDDTSRLHRAPINIDFEEGGALELRYAHGDPSSIMRVSLTQLDLASASPKPLKRKDQQGDSGQAFVETHLRVGRYQWDMKLGSVEASGIVAIKRGTWTRVTMNAETQATLGALGDAVVEIDVSSAPGVDLSNWTTGAFFEGDFTQGSVGNQRPRSTRDPNLWTVTVGGLSDDKWMLCLAPQPGFQVTPMLAPLVPGGAPSKVTVTRIADTIPVTLHLVDPESGEPIMDAQACHIDGLTAFPVEENKDPLAGFGPHPTPSDHSSRFLVNAPGYKLTEWIFDPAQAKLESGADSAQHVIRLERGWRSRVFVIDVSTQSTVPGVSVHVNGKHVGETDSDGCYWITGAQLPTELAVARLNEDLEVVLNSFDALEGQESPSPIGYTMMIRPRQE